MTTFRPKTKRELLAYTIAETFNDSGHLQLYLTYCKKYATHIIQRAYAEARSIPQERIKKSRAALFFYLVKQYAHKPQLQNNRQSEHDPRN